MIRSLPLGPLVSFLVVAVLASPVASHGQEAEAQPADGVQEAARAGQSAPDSCATCHGALGDERLSRPAERFPEDIHAVRGFGCTACHGGDAAIMGPDAMDPDKGYIGVPQRGLTPEICGRCHSNAEFMRRYNPGLRVDQVAEYWTSEHGQRLAASDDSMVATCSSCHTPHSIRPASDPQSSVYPLNVAALCGSCHADPEHMAEYGTPTNQRERYERSVHWAVMSEGADLSAPTCNDCHGNHGAAPPGVNWVGNVCSQCHPVEGGLYAGSFHSQILTIIGQPGCATCHGNHEIVHAEDDMLGVGEGAVCTQCHTAESRGGQTAAGMRALIDSLRTGFDRADSLLHRAEQAGMEVSEAQFELNDARNSLVRSRTALHTFSVDSVRASVQAGLEVTAVVSERGLEALQELRTRRLGLTVSALIIVVLIAGLVVKIRQVEGTG